MKPKEKILESSYTLFREKGYQATGISEILEKAGAYKKTLYDHFESKDHIGFEYLNHLSIQQSSVMLKMLDKAKGVDDFIEKWVSFVLRNQRHSARKDCPIALFSGEVSHLPQFERHTSKAVQHVLDTIESCIQKFRSDVKSETLRSLSTELYILYLGGLRLYSLTKDRKVIERMKEQMKIIVLRKK